MNHWLIKSDPDDYAFADLEREGQTAWTGVRNAQAQGYLREMKRGDRVLVYHTGKEKHLVGVATVTRGAYPDPDDPRGKLVLVDIQARRRLKKLVSLADIKADAQFADLLLVRHSRLSVMPVDADSWKALLKLGGLA